ncbi:MAG TPA: polysaccharide deacetylase [Thiobacillaceae bacterium]|nr:polysaccharide deacetylase [Thiobacillaceae bacterium]HNU65336.1 polysaccharide deacetylase [Thiobacillaceae bacterium]
MTRARYALVTVDTEAQPARAAGEHVRRLIWGEHPGGTAGIRELCAAAREVAARLVFFVDACGVYQHGAPYEEAVRWLVQAGHDVQLHTHSEFLPDSFWHEHGFPVRPRLLNQYDEARAAFTLRFFSEHLARVKGGPITAFRAGSFRWNAGTLRAQAELGLPLSFNNSMRAWVDGVCPHAETLGRPFAWSNGVIEVPITERRFPSWGPAPWWGRLAFPSSQHHRDPPWRVLWPYTLGRDVPVLVLLLHSWSLLYWDENGHAEYRDKYRLEDFRKLMRRLAKDYDIITTQDFLALQASGKIPITHTVGVARARAGTLPGSEI